MSMLITGARAPIALDLARSFEAAGERVLLADAVAPWSVRLSGRGGRLRRYAAPVGRFERFRADLRALIAAEEPALIVPTSEEVFHLAQAAALDGWTDRLFAPPITLLRRLHSKADFPVLVAEAGLPAPATRRLTSAEDLAALAADADQLVFKPEFSRFAADTLVRPDAAALARVSPTPERAWVAQDFVAGEEICVWSAAIRGRLAAFAAYRPRWRLESSAGFYFERVRDECLIAFASAMAAHLGATGQLAYDLIRTRDGRLLPLECNPRGISGVHLFGGRAGLARALLGGESGLAEPAGAAGCLAPAMWLFGLPQALRRRRLPAFRKDLAGARDALSGGGREPFAALGGLLDFTGFTLRGAPLGLDATRAGTRDIEWNGGDFI